MRGHNDNRSPEVLRQLTLDRCHRMLGWGLVFCEGAVLADVFAITKWAIARLPPKAFHPPKAAFPNFGNPFALWLWWLIRTVETLEKRSSVVRNDQPHRAPAILTSGPLVHESLQAA